MTFPVLHSTMHPDAIAEFVHADYHLGGTAPCSVWHRGFNDYFLVQAPSGRYVLRVYPTDKYWMPTESDVRFELDLLAHLHAAGLPVVPAVPRRAGDVLGSIDAPEGTRYTALFAFAAGGRKELDVEDGRTLGATCARIHIAAAHFATSHRRYHLDADLLLEMPIREVTTFLGGSRADDLRTLRALADAVRARIETIPRREPFYGVIHADLHGGNCHWAAGQPTVLDFDHCGHGWRAYDLVAAIEGVADDVRDGILEGYRAQRDMTDEEVDLLPVFRHARVIWDNGDVLAMADHLGVRARLNAAFWDRYFAQIRSMLDEHR